jgi:general secretion pathway protein I
MMPTAASTGACRAVPGERASEAGFTLLEVIVALAILAVSLGVLFPTFSDAVQRAGQSESIAEARLLAQSILVQVGNEIPVKAGEAAGDDASGLHWRLRQKPYGDSADRARWLAPVMEVSVEVSWGAGLPVRSISLSTLRLAPSPAAR